MKKVLLIIIYFVNVTGIVQSQTIKQITKKTIQSPVKKKKEIDTLELVKVKAIEWFKNVYVEQNFNDPYSYRPLKTRVEKVMVKEFLQSEIDSFKSKIAELQPEADTASGINYKYQLYLKYYNEFLDESKKADNEYSKQDYLKDANEYYELLQTEKVKLDAAGRYILGQKELIKTTEDFLNSLSEYDKKQTAYYLVYHDSHGSNSIGNTVLGRYVFKYDLKKNKGYDVVQMNK